MTDSIKYGDLVMNQGTSNHFQSSTDFEKNLNLLKDKIWEFFNLKNVNFLFGSGTSNGAIPTIASLEFTHEEEKTESEFNIIATKC